jgi:outer membrane usher protein
MLRAIRNLAALSVPLCCFAHAAENSRTLEPVFLAVSLNGEDEGVTLLLRRGDALFVSLDDLRKWRLRTVLPVVETRGGVRYGVLSAVAGLIVKLDEQQQRLELTAPAALFARNEIEAGSGAPVVLSPRSFSAFVNYELGAQVVDGEVGGNAFTEAGFADHWGVITTSAVGQLGQGGASHVLRLDTSYIYDDPQALTRLVLGDSVTRGNAWIRPVRFAGLQFGTDFALQPNFISFPSPSFAGQATLPTVVQAYVNDALRYTGTIPQGPFDLRQVPVVTGAGEVELLVKDSAGVQRSIRSSYYVSPNLLRSGLQDYSFEGGFVRGAYGLDSFSYSQPFASATYRRGLTDFVTGELHLQGAGRVQTGGAGVAWVIPPVGELNLAGAASRNRGRGGVLGSASFSHIARWWSLVLSYQKASRNFVQIGADRPADQVQTQAQAFASVSLGRFGSLSTSLTELGMGDGSRSCIAAVNYDVSIGETAYLGAFALTSHNSGSRTSVTIGLQVTFPFGGRDSATAGLSDTDGRLDGRAEFRHDPPFGTGIGYRALIAPTEATRANGQVTWRNDVSTVTAEAADTNTGIGVRVLANGSLAYAGGKVFAARGLGDAFGVATVSDYPNVRVYQENQLVGRTDSAGRIALPELRAYEENRISIDPNDVPLEAQVSRDVQALVPALHGAAVADFSVIAMHGAIVVLVGEDGIPLKPGLPVSVDGHVDAAFTGYDGQVYVERVREGVVLEAGFEGQKCAAKLGIIPAAMTQPHIGPITCRRTPQ